LERGGGSGEGGETTDITEVDGHTGEAFWLYHLTTGQLGCNGPEREEFG
jgi:hypothetical protein